MLSSLCPQPPPPPMPPPREACRLAVSASIFFSSSATRLSVFFCLFLVGCVTTQLRPALAHRRQGPSGSAGSGSHRTLSPRQASHARGFLASAPSTPPPPTIITPPSGDAAPPPPPPCMATGEACVPGVLPWAPDAGVAEAGDVGVKAVEPPEDDERAPVAVATDGDAALPPLPPPLPPQSGRWRGPCDAPAPLCWMGWADPIE